LRELLKMRRIGKGRKLIKIT